MDTSVHWTPLSWVGEATPGQRTDVLCFATVLPPPYSLPPDSGGDVSFLPLSRPLGASEFVTQFKTLILCRSTTSATCQ